MFYLKRKVGKPRNTERQNSVSHKIVEEINHALQNVNTSALQSYKKNVFRRRI